MLEDALLVITAICLSACEMGCHRCHIGVRSYYIPLSFVDIMDDIVQNNLQTQATLDMLVKITHVQSGLVIEYPFPSDPEAAAAWKQTPALWYQFCFMHKLVDFCQEYVSPCANLQRTCFRQICRAYSNHIADISYGDAELDRVHKLLNCGMPKATLRNVLRQAANDGARPRPAIMQDCVFNVFSCNHLKACTVCDHCGQCPICGTYNEDVYSPGDPLSRGRSLYAECNRVFNNFETFLSNCNSMS